MENEKREERRQPLTPESYATLKATAPERVRVAEQQVRDRAGAKGQYYLAAVHDRVETGASPQTVELRERRSLADEERGVLLARQRQNEERDGPHNPGTLQGILEAQPGGSGKEGALYGGAKQQRQ